jgi:hypothetical protein
MSLRAALKIDSSLADWTMYRLLVAYQTLPYSRKGVITTDLAMDCMMAQSRCNSATTSEASKVSRSHASSWQHLAIDRRHDRNSDSIWDRTTFATQSFFPRTRLERTRQGHGHSLHLRSEAGAGQGRSTPLVAASTFRVNRRRRRGQLMVLVVPSLYTKLACKVGAP